MHRRLIKTVDEFNLKSASTTKLSGAVYPRLWEVGILRGQSVIS
jgi:hypothetical protein